MKASQQAYDAMVHDVTNAWRDQETEEPPLNGVVPDGGRVSISMTMMDGVQSLIADQTAIDERARQSATDNAFILDKSRRDADRAAAYADHFTRQRQQQDAALSGGPAYDAMRARVSNAYKEAR